MNDLLAIHSAVAVLFSFMAFRAFRSASAVDYLLASAQCAGLLLLLAGYYPFAYYFLLITAVAYLLSQVMTGARPVSRLLPLAGAALILMTFLW